jgi:hypothetical protein
MPRSPLHTAPLACLLLLWSACAFDRAPELAAEDATGDAADLTADEDRDLITDPDLTDPRDADLASPDLPAPPDLPEDAAPDLPPPDPTWWERRAQDGLLALTRFPLDGAQIAFDTPGLAPLAVSGGDLSAIPGRGGVAVLSPSAITTPEVPDLVEQIATTDAFTLELWLRPHNLAQRGPAPIVWWGSPDQPMNLRVAQQGRALWVTLNTDPDAPPLQLELPAALSGAPTHLALSWARGELVAWINGAEVLRRPPEFPLPGLSPPSLRGWDRGAALRVASQPGAPSPWLGELYLLALYQRALTAEEVAGHLALGPGPEPAPSQTVSIEPATQAIAEEQPGAPAWIVRRRGDISGPLALSYRLLGSARDGEDYGLPDPLSFPPGERERAISLAPRADMRAEGNERALLQLISGADYALEGDARASVALRDGDAPPQENLLLWLQGESLDCAPGQSATTWGDNRDPALTATASGGARCQADPWALLLDADGALQLPAELWGAQARLSLVLVFELLADPDSDDADGAVLTLRRAQEQQSLTVFQERGALLARIQNLLVQEERPLPTHDDRALLTLRVQLNEDGMNFGAHEVTLNEQATVSLPGSPLQLRAWDRLTVGATDERPGAPLRLRELLLYGGAPGAQKLARLFTWIHRQRP